MEITTFDDDLLGLKDFAARLHDYIQVERQFVAGSLVVALSSKFGSGKTTFLKMWKNQLEESNASNRPLLISLNAWESDYYGDPLFAITSELAASLDESDGSRQSLINAAKDVGWFSIAITGQVMSKLTGIDAIAAGDIAKKKKDEREDSDSQLMDAFSAYQVRKEMMGRLQETIKNIVKEKSDSLVLFLVDELDRCRPDYAIAYLECIKHIFDVQGVAFILAADRDQLENSAKQAFGVDLDFNEYYRKFIHREVLLPSISDSGYTKLASEYVTHYLQLEGFRHCFMESSTATRDEVIGLVGALKLTPRQIQEMFRILGHALHTSVENKGAMNWCFGAGVIAMAAFKMGNPKVFDLLGSNRWGPREAFGYLNELVGRDNSDFWFELFLTGGGIKKKPGQSDVDVLTEVKGNNGDENTRIGSDLGYWYRRWGYYSPPESPTRFIEIRSKIEYVSQWN
jgi:hypothetical protein